MAQIASAIEDIPPPRTAWRVMIEAEHTCMSILRRRQGRFPLARVDEAALPVAAQRTIPPEQACLAAGGARAALS